METQYKNIFIFHDNLFSESIKESITSTFSKSSLLKDKFLDKINQINFYLKKENNHLYILSLSLNLNGKNIHIEEKQEDVYHSIKSILNKLERKIKKEK